MGIGYRRAMIFEGFPLAYTGGMYFRQFVHEEKSCLSYLIGCQACRAAMVVDPQMEIEPYLREARREGMQITHVIDTHTHADHLSGASALAREVGVPVAQLKDGEVFQVGNRVVKVIATPGHTDDSLCLYIDDWYVLTGDTLFVSDVGRVDLALEDTGEEEMRRAAERLYDSIQRLLLLPDWTEVYPGHFGGSACGKGISGKMISTIGREKRRNKALALSREEFVSYVLTDTPSPPEDFREIKQRNIAAAQLPVV